jgi:hypothetical protein
VLPEAAPAARGGLAYVLCGALQLLAFLTYVTGFSLAVNAGAAWAVAGGGALGVYARLVVFGGGGLLAMGILRPSGSSSAAGSRGASGRGARPTSGSGSSRRWSSPTRWPRASPAK